MRFLLHLARWLHHQVLRLAGLLAQLERRIAAPETATGEETEIAIVLHAFHLDVFEEMLPLLAHFSQDCHHLQKLFVTTHSGLAEGVHQRLHDVGLEHELVVLENRGRDILPFLELARSGRLDAASAILKIHTKSHRDLSAGRSLNASILADLLDCHLAERVLARAAAGEEFVSLPGHYIYGATSWGRNARRTAALARQLGVRLPHRLKFPAGSMFWITPGLARVLADLRVGAEDFEAEPLPRDGALPHAIERMFGVVADTHGVGVLPSESL